MIQMILMMLLQTSMLVFGQVFLKLGMKDMGAWQWSWAYIWHEVILNIWFVLGLVLLVGANVFWLWLLDKYPFSQIYPLTSLGFVFGMLSGVFIFHETVGYLQWIGVVMVMMGCYFIAKA
ncbi:MAG: EamA family transporter [Paludibacteraceae bacterium]|nr:EamA family transporter [Paludibacteraceae bacterium]